MNIEDALRVIANYCLSRQTCEGCRFFGTGEACFFALCDLPCDWDVTQNEPRN